MYMWRAVDSEGEVLEILVQPQRDKAAAVRLLRKLLRRQGFVLTVIITDKQRSYGAALREIGFSGRRAFRFRWRAKIFTVLRGSNSSNRAFYRAFFCVNQPDFKFRKRVADPAPSGTDCLRAR